MIMTLSPFLEYLIRAMSMPFTQFGPLRKIVIAARFDIHVPVGWPELQLVRIANNETYNVVLTTNATEPKPTGYLNLYECDLAPKNFDIQAGDKLNIACMTRSVSLLPTIITERPQYQWFLLLWAIVIQK